MPECTPPIQFLQQVLPPSAAQLRFHNDSNQLISLKMKVELEQTKDKLKQAPNVLSVWKFTPDRQKNHTPQPRLP